MFVLFSTNPYHGHFEPLTPLARACRDAGHDVAFASTPAFAPVVRAAGFEAVEAGVTPTAAWPWQEPITLAKARDLLDLAASAGAPDLVVRDMTDFGAVVAADVLGVPHVTVSGGLLFFERAWWRQLVGRDLDAVRARYGLAPDPRLRRLFRYGCLDTTPRWFQLGSPGRVATHRFYRVPPRPAASDGPGPAVVDRSAPLVYVTLGTVFNHRPRLLRRILEGLSGGGFAVLCTVGHDVDRRALFRDGPPAGVTVEPWLPQEDVLPHCAAIVTHGGYSTLTGALRHGVPPLVVPLGADHALNARRCVHLGIGRAVTPSRLTRTGVRVAVTALVSGPTCRQHLRALLRTDRDVPGIEQAVPALAQLADTRRSGSSRRRP